MTGLLVVAASGLAREALAVERLLGRYPRVVVLDDDPRLWGSEVAGHPDRFRHLRGGSLRRRVVQRLEGLHLLRPERATERLTPERLDGRLQARCLYIMRQATRY